MNSRLLANAFLVLLFCASGCRQITAIRPITEDEAEGQKLLDANIHDTVRAPLTDAEIKTILQDNIDSDQQSVGLVVGIVDEHGTRVISHGKMLHSGDRDVDGDTLFGIGSVTKVFTTLLLQDMLERGEMKLDDPVQKYLPDSVRMPTRNGKQITLLHLATHTSGLPRDPANPSPKTLKDRHSAGNKQELYDFLSHCRLTRDPGTQMEYSNLGMGLLGDIIALKAGKDYETLVIERICRPLGMDGTRIALTPELKARLATGHHLPDRPVKVIDYDARTLDERILLGAGSLRSTVNDLLKFISAEVGPTSSELTPLMIKSRDLHRLQAGQFRLGWEPGPLLVHGGLTNGYRAQLWCDPEKRWGAVVLSNCASWGIAEVVMDRLRNNQSPKPHRTAPADPPAFEDYIGQYQTKGGAVFTARLEGDRRILRWVGKPSRYGGLASFEVFPQSRTVFYNQMWNVQATFRDAQGQPPQLLISNPPARPEPAIRISTRIPPPRVPIQPDSKAYESYAGQYRMAAFFGLFRFGPVLSVWCESDQLGPHLTGFIPEVGAAELYPESEITFMTTDLPGSRVTFIRNKAGKATKGRLRLNGSDYNVVRVSDKPAQ